MELCAAGERWEMVAEPPRRAGGGRTSPRPLGVSRRGAAGLGSWGRGGFVTAGPGAGDEAAPAREAVAISPGWGCPKGAGCCEGPAQPRSHSSGGSSLGWAPKCPPKLSSSSAACRAGVRAGNTGAHGDLSIGHQGIHVPTTQPQTVGSGEAQ